MVGSFATDHFFVFILLLYVEEEVHDVSILDDIFLALDSEFSSCSAGCF